MEITRSRKYQELETRKEKPDRKTPQQNTKTMRGELWKTGSTLLQEGG